MPVAIAVVAVVVAAGSAAYSSYVQQDNAKDAEKVANQQAAMEQQAGERDAQNIRDRAARLKGMQVAALAGAGTNVESGTGNAVLNETDRLSQRDALAAIREGQQRADIVRAKGQLTSANYQAGSIATALNGVSNILGGITSYQKATAGTNLAATQTAYKPTLIDSRTPAGNLLGGTSY